MDVGVGLRHLYAMARRLQHLLECAHRRATLRVVVGGTSRRCAESCCRLLILGLHPQREPTGAAALLHLHLHLHLLHLLHLLLKLHLLLLPRVKDLQRCLSGDRRLSGASRGCCQPLLPLREPTGAAALLHLRLHLLLHVLLLLLLQLPFLQLELELLKLLRLEVLEPMLLHWPLVLLLLLQLELELELLLLVMLELMLEMLELLLLLLLLLIMPLQLQLLLLLLLLLLEAYGGVGAGRHSRRSAPLVARVLPLARLVRANLAGLAHLSHTGSSSICYGRRLLCHFRRSARQLPPCLAIRVGGADSCARTAEQLHELVGRLLNVDRGRPGCARWSPGWQRGGRRIRWGVPRLQAAADGAAIVVAIKGADTALHIVQQALLLGQKLLVAHLQPLHVTEGLPSPVEAEVGADYGGQRA